MKTNKIEFTTANVSTAVPSLTQETEKLADCGGLGRREKMKLVLITEELAEAVKNLINYGAAVFCAENKGNEYTISFTIKPDKTIYNDERKKLISYSTSGKNASATGVSGKIREMAEKVIADHLELKEMNTSNFMGHRNEAFLSDGSVVWSLTSYRSDAEEGTEEWDELEMSILANAADEITVGIMGGIVEINAYKKF